MTCRISTAIAAVLLGTHLAAQQPSQDQPVFRSGVSLIEVDVRVFDEEGRFVTDLTRDDFEIVEAGTPQTIEALYLVGSPAAAAPFAPPEASSELRAVPSGTARQTWIFVFDTNHLVPGAGFDRAKQAVVEFLKTRFKEGDVGGIVADGKMIDNRLTSVREELVSAATRVRANTDIRSVSLETTREWPRLRDALEAIQISLGDKEALDRAIVRACTDEPDWCRRVPPDGEVRNKARRLHTLFEQMTRQTLTTVNALASGLAKMAGPKTIVLLSDGFVTERMESDLRRSVGQTTRAGGRIYAIDVRGLDRGRGAGIIDQAALDDVGAPPQFDAQADGPNSLAVDTGGLMIRNENNIGRALDTIAEDTGTYYVVGYRPTNQVFDGKFREIDVRVKRPGVRVRARRGYLAIEPSRLLTPQPITAPTTPPADKRDASPDPTDVVSAADPDARPLPPHLRAEPLPPTTAGKVVEGGATASGTEMRMRPDAIERVREMAGAGVTDSGALASKGWAAYERGDVESAVVAFTEAAKQPDVRPWVLYALGLSHVALGKPLDAVAAWERVRSAAPEFSAVYIDLADVYLQLSEESQALAILREGSTRWPQDPEFHNAIGVIHVRRGAFDEGIESFERAAAVAPDDPLAYFNLGRAYQMRHSRDTRYVAALRRWVSPERDRTRAIEYYQKYLEMGGPYVAQAKDAIRMLEWAKR